MRIAAGGQRWFDALARTVIRSSIVAVTERTCATTPAAVRVAAMPLASVSATRTERPAKVTGSPAASSAANAAAQSSA
ncbi:MAG: hypothetical protein QG597_3890, partial [Actinomycetota bacterium]|nr:hypothetical protein [Actinomycetota bacterium]